MMFSGVFFNLFLQWSEMVWYQGQCLDRTSLVLALLVLALFSSWHIFKGLVYKLWLTDWFSHSGWHLPLINGFVLLLRLVPDCVRMLWPTRWITNLATFAGLLYRKHCETDVKGLLSWCVRALAEGGEPAMAAGKVWLKIYSCDPPHVVIQCVYNVAVFLVILM